MRLINVGMHTHGEGFYCRNLDDETWESSWVNECTRGMHPWEELCFTVKPKWMKVDEVYPSPPTLQKDPECPQASPFWWLRSAVNQSTFHFRSNLDAEQEVGFALTMLRSYTAFHSYIDVFMPLNPDMYVFSSCSDSRLTCTSVLLLCVWCQYVSV